VQNAGVRERVQRQLEQHSGDERMLDAYWQWAMNPTPPSAGYALEENSGFIATNLMNRYGAPAIDVVSQLTAECADLQRDASVYDLQQAVIGVLNGTAGDLLRQGVVDRLNDPAPARQLLAAWLVSRARWAYRQGKDAWLAGEFDWSLGADLELATRDAASPTAALLFGPDAAEVDLPREGLAAGVVNRLFYRSTSGRMEPKLRPGPRIPLSGVIY